MPSRPGSSPNIIPDRAEILVNLRSSHPAVRAHLLEAVTRVVTAEARGSRAPRDPEVETVLSAPAAVNDADASARTGAALERALGAGAVDPGPVTGSEDVGILATSAGAPLVYWLLGGADPAPFRGATTIDAVARVVGTLPSNHSPFAPVVEPTLRVGVQALTTAALEWLLRLTARAPRRARA